MKKFRFIFVALLGEGVLPLGANGGKEPRNKKFLIPNFLLILKKESKKMVMFIKDFKLTKCTICKIKKLLFQVIREKNYCINCIEKFKIK